MTRQDNAVFARLAAELRGDVLDEADQAARLQLLEVERGLLELRRESRPGPQLFDADGKTVLCWECEAPIEPERLAIQPGAGFCVPCLEAIERRRRQEAR